MDPFLPMLSRSLIPLSTHFLFPRFHFQSHLFLPPVSLYFFGRRPTERHASGLLDEMVASGSVVRNFYFSPAAERAPSRGRPSYHLSLPFPLPLVEKEAFKTGLEGHKKSERERGPSLLPLPFLGRSSRFPQLPFFLVLSPFWSFTSSDPFFASFSARERNLK